ncbi:MAG: Uma2 family endonuclease [Dehalococcoidia bacterium]
MTTTAKLTLEQFLAIPETKPASEYVDGEVIQKPMPDQKHSLLQAFLARILDEFLEITRLGVVGTEWRCIFGPPGFERPYVPDLIVVRRERQTPDRHFHGPPDLAIEILSPDQPAGEFAERILFYVMHGVRLTWVIDPQRLIITAYVPGREPRRLTVEDTLDGGGILPGFSVPVERIFARIRDL